jgi:hypothetical protein
MATFGGEKIPMQGPSWLTWAYVVLAVAVVVLFTWGMIVAGGVP